MKTEIIDVEEIQEIIIAYANGDFSRRLNESGNRDSRDSVVSGINMLGEELEQTSISKEYFEGICNAISDILLVANEKLIISDANDLASKELGFTQEELIGMDLMTLIKIIPDEILSCPNNEKSVSFETTMQAKNLTALPVSCKISQIRPNFNKTLEYLVIARDISDKLEQEKKVLRAIVNAEEKIRKQLAFDLHDSLGQELNAVKMYLDTYRFLANGEMEHVEIFENCNHILRRSIDEVRDISFSLLPKSLENANLSYAIKEMLSKLKELITIDYKIGDMTRVIPKEDELIIFRVFQEFINNSLKYAEASKISVILNENDNQVMFEITDDGIGFDINSKSKSNGNGVNNIKTRLNTIKSSYNYFSKPGEGTSLRFVYNHEDH